MIDGSIQILTPVEAAAYLRMSQSFLAQRRCEGGGPRFLKIGRSVKYRVQDLDEWLAAQARSHTSDRI